MVRQKALKKFTTHNHSQAWKLYKARPKGGAKDPGNTNKDFCIYHAAHKDYTYSQKWIDHLIKSVESEAVVCKNQGRNALMSHGLLLPPQCQKSRLKIYTYPRPPPPRLNSSHPWPMRDRVSGPSVTWGRGRRSGITACAASHLVPKGVVAARAAGVTDHPGPAWSYASVGKPRSISAGGFFSRPAEDSIRREVAGSRPARGAPIRTP